jgi:hypothetical protein
MKHAPRKFNPRAGRIKCKSRLFIPERSKASRVKSTEGIAYRFEGLCKVESRITQGAAKESGIGMVTKLSENEYAIAAKLSMP